MFIQPKGKTMKYIVTTEKSIDETAKDLENAVISNQFGVLHIHDLKATMKKKGIEFQNECRIFEVCNPQKANAVLTQDMSLNMALPCRISIWEENETVYIGTINPSALLSILSDSEELKTIALDVEQTIKKIIDEAR